MRTIRFVLATFLVAFFIAGGVAFGKDKEPALIRLSTSPIITGTQGFISCIVMNHSGRPLEGTGIYAWRYNNTEEWWEYDDNYPDGPALANHGTLNEENVLWPGEPGYCEAQYLGYDTDDVRLTACFQSLGGTPVSCITD